MRHRFHSIRLYFAMFPETFVKKHLAASPHHGVVFGPFFRLCFHRDTLPQVLYLRSEPDWRHRKDDRFIAALCLGALHGESHRTRTVAGGGLEPRRTACRHRYQLEDRQYADECISGGEGVADHGA